MSIRFRFFLLIVAVGLLWGGGQGVITAATSRRPTPVTCADYYSAAPRAKWLELHECLAYLPDGSHFYPEGTDPNADASQVYVPLYVPGDSAQARARVVMATRDPELLAIYNGFPDDAGDEAQKAYLQKHAARLAEVRTVRGLVRFGIDLDERERSQLAGEEVASDFVIVDEGAEPRMAFSLLMMAGGLASALGALGLHRRAAPRRTPAG